MEEYGKVVLHPSHETEEYLVEEIKKVSADSQFFVTSIGLFKKMALPWCKKL